MDKRAKAMSSRLRFKVMDVVEFRKRKWVDNSKPNTKKKQRPSGRPNGVRRTGSRQRTRMKVHSQKGKQINSTQPNVWGKGRGAVQNNISFADKLKKQKQGDRYAQ